MGGAACIIIIRCGLVKASADELAAIMEGGQSPDMQRLHAAAVRLSTLEGELCDLGPELVEYLTDDEKVSVIRNSQTSVAFADKIDAFCCSHPGSAEVAQLLAEVRLFTSSQFAFFDALVAAHESDS